MMRVPHWTLSCRKILGASSPSMSDTSSFHKSKEPSFRTEGRSSARRSRPHWPHGQRLGGFRTFGHIQRGACKKEHIGIIVSHEGPFV